MNIPLLLDAIRTTGIIVGIIYYLSILRNQQKNRMLEIVSRRAEHGLNFEYQHNTRKISQLYTGWTTPEEFEAKYGYDKAPEANVAMFIARENMNQLGFLFREGLISENHIDRLYSPWYIIQFWETFRSMLFEEREIMGNDEYMRDFEFLYDVIKKKYPHISSKTKFAWTKWLDE